MLSRAKAPRSVPVARRIQHSDADFRSTTFDAERVAAVTLDPASLSSRLVLCAAIATLCRRGPLAITRQLSRGPRRSSYGWRSRHSGSSIWCFSAHVVMSSRPHDRRGRRGSDGGCGASARADNALTLPFAAWSAAVGGRSGPASRRLGASARPCIRPPARLILSRLAIRFGWRSEWALDRRAFSRLCAGFRCAGSGAHRMDLDAQGVGGDSPPDGSWTSDGTDFISGHGGESPRILESGWEGDCQLGLRPALGARSRGFSTTDLARLQNPAVAPTPPHRRELEQLLDAASLPAHSFLSAPLRWFHARL